MGVITLLERVPWLKALAQSACGSLADSSRQTYGVGCRLFLIATTEPRVLGRS